MRATLVAAGFSLSLAGCFLWRSAEPPPPPAVAPEPEPAAPPAAPPEPPVPAPAPQPPTLQLTLRASDQLNPDERGQPLPTVVVVYQLKSGSKVAAADAEDLYRRPKEVLGEDLLHADELQLAPGQVETRTLDRDQAARTLAVVALVRQPKGPGFRSIVDLPPPGQPAELSFVLDGYRVVPDSVAGEVDRR